MNARHQCPLCCGPELPAFGTAVHTQHPTGVPFSPCAIVPLGTPFKTLRSLPFSKCQTRTAS
jgi:hypothetical protein